MINSYGSLSPIEAVKASGKLLAVGQPKMYLQRTGQTDDQPMNSTRTRKWRRYHSFPITKAPLAEGIAPAEQQLTYTDYVCVLQQYGSRYPITDVVADTHTDPILQVLMTRGGEQAAKVTEVVTFDCLKGGTNVYFANNAANRAAVNSPLTAGDVRRLLRQFDRQYAQEITEIISPSAKVSTAGVEGGYYAYAHTDIWNDLRKLSGFKTVVEYGDPSQALPGEKGAFERLRFILSPLYEPWYAAGTSGTTYLANTSAPSTSTACDVYPIVVVARDSYAVVRLQGKKAVKVMVHNPGQPAIGNELGQKGFVSWIMWYGCARLNEQWIARIEVACTANPT